MSEAFPQTKHSFQVEDDLIKLVTLHFDEEELVVTVAFADDRQGMVPSYVRRILRADKNGIEHGQAGLWVHYRWQPLRWLPQLSIMRKEFF